MKRMRCTVMVLIAGALLLAAASAGADEAKLLKGDLWQQMDIDEKVAFIWGAGQVITVEEAIWKQMPELKVANFSAKVVEGLADVSINEIIAKIDQFYTANPDQLNVSVMRVVWDQMIKPNLKTGIGDRPL